MASKYLLKVVVIPASRLFCPCSELGALTMMLDLPKWFDTLVGVDVHVRTVTQHGWNISVYEASGFSLVPFEIDGGHYSHFIRSIV